MSATPWQANEQFIAKSINARPDIIYRESDVPAYTLPDPLALPNGGRVKTAEQWAQHRPVVLDTFAREMFGRSPGMPASLRYELLEQDDTAVAGRATFKRVAVHSEHAGRKHTFEIVMLVPNDAPAPCPAFMLINFRAKDRLDPHAAWRTDFWPAEQGIERGYAMIAIEAKALSIDDDPAVYRDGIINLFEGGRDPRPGDAFGTLAAWAWGASRAMDYLETDPAIDEKRVAIIGHSRGGKAALWTGATDERFAMVISNNSGCGGAAISRRRFGETVSRINAMFPGWFCGNFKRYNHREDELPFDQHMLVALIAPRFVYVASADDDLWADPRGEYLGLAHASPVYALFGHEPVEAGNMPPLDQPITAGPRGYHVRSGPHGLTAVAWGHYMNAADELWAASHGTLERR